MTTATRPMSGTSDSLGILDEALARADETNSLAARYLDPSLVDMLHVIGFDRRFVRARGSWLYDSEGREYLDFHTGEGFASLGHGHPDVRETLEAVLAADLTDGVQIHYSVLAGMLAQELTGLLPDSLDATFFGSSGAEVVDSVMKFARAATGRPRLLSCDGGYHGVTIGPLSLVGDEFFKEGFEPLLPGCARVPSATSTRSRPSFASAMSSVHHRADPGQPRAACRRRDICAPRRTCAGSTAPVRARRGPDRSRTDGHGDSPSTASAWSPTS